jgi:hypothetical protein
MWSLWSTVTCKAILHVRAYTLIQHMHVRRMQAHTRQAAWQQAKSCFYFQIKHSVACMFLHPPSWLSTATDRPFRGAGRMRSYQRLGARGPAPPRPVPTPRHQQTHRAASTQEYGNPALTRTMQAKQILACCIYTYLREHACACLFVLHLRLRHQRLVRYSDVHGCISVRRQATSKPSDCVEPREPSSEPSKSHLSTQTSWLVGSSTPLGVDQAKSHFNILLNIL